MNKLAQCLFLIDTNSILISKTSIDFLFYHAHTLFPYRHKKRAFFCYIFSPNRQGRSELRSSGRSVSPSPIRYHSPGGLATHLSHKVTSKSFKEAAASASSNTASSGLRLSNLTPPGSRKYGTHSMGGNYERSDSSSSSTANTSSNSASYASGKSSAKPLPIVVKTPPVSRKVGRASPPLTGKGGTF